MKFFLIAGEESGDVIGAKLIRALKHQLKNQHAEFVGVGGKRMRAEGLKSIFPSEDLAVMGFLEVIPHLTKLIARINQAAAAVLKEMPDCLITIDAPDFNFRVVKRIKAVAETKSIKKIHIVAPSVWAYRAGRAKKIAALYDLLLAFLPFEPPYFQKHGLKTVFVGHPIVEEYDKFSASEIAEFRQKNKITDKDILLCVMPGSRISEVKKIFPEFISATNLLLTKFPNLKVVIPLVEKSEALVREMCKNLACEYFLVKSNLKTEAFAAADFALAKSGTNALELAIYEVPLVVAYKINWLSSLIVKSLVKVKFVNLINLILNKKVVPELIQADCNPSSIAVELTKLMLDKTKADRQITESNSALMMLGLGKKPASEQMAEAILRIK